MATTPFVLTDIQKVAYTLTAVDKDNNPATLATGATVAVTSSAPTTATVAPDASPAAGSIASGFIVAGAALGTAQISAAVTNADGSPGPTGSVSVQVTASAAAQISFGLGSPVAQ